MGIGELVSLVVTGRCRKVYAPIVRPPSSSPFRFVIDTKFRPFVGPAVPIVSSAENVGGVILDADNRDHVSEANRLFHQIFENSYLFHVIFGYLSVEEILRSQLVCDLFRIRTEEWVKGIRAKRATAAGVQHLITGNPYLRTRDETRDAGAAVVDGLHPGENIKQVLTDPIRSKEVGPEFHEAVIEFLTVRSWGDRDSAYWTRERIERLIEVGNYASPKSYGHKFRETALDRMFGY